MNKSNFIIFVGFMGSGKSTIGKLAAKQLGYQFIDTDKWIAENEGRSIPEIFETHGESYFRKLEMNCIKSLEKLEGNFVVATGGGMPCNQYRLSRLLRLGKVIYLEIDAKSAIRRLSQAKEKRPLLEGLTPTQLEIKITKLLNKRARYYSQADINVSSLEAKKVDFRELFV